MAVATGGGNGGSDGKNETGGTVSPPAVGTGSGAPLYVDPSELETPTRAIAAAGTHLGDLRTQLAMMLPVWGLLGFVFPGSDQGTFGDSTVESAWRSYHTAWLAETGVSAAAVTEAAKLVSDSNTAYRAGDEAGGRVVGGTIGPTR
ncbi:hypothetical protein [Nocardia sp. BMG111209]|uniref:hypothetical protein n=1 Tax=Nocardia sp. BMG111209 TaxID=1160137 RepID=UPI000376D8FB|nr:hypothetical protein [Nocardia sp. BMG111209]